MFYTKKPFTKHFNIPGTPLNIRRYLFDTVQLEGDTVQLPKFVKFGFRYIYVSEHQMIPAYIQRIVKFESVELSFIFAMF